MAPLMIGSQADNTEQVEIDLLLEAMFRVYGYDFRDYARASLQRRLAGAMEDEGALTVSAFQDRILHDPAAMVRFYQALSVSVTSMFRDPEFFARFRAEIVPRLRTYPFIRLWHAGCATGEEVYSMAILLQEEGVYGRCRIYATDLSPAALARARRGTFPLRYMKTNTANYLASGGKSEFSAFYTAHAEDAVFHAGLSKNMVFSQHNLVTDGSFNEFNVIICRNVLIYFSKTLQDRVQKLFHGSLVPFGILGLGSHESLKFSAVEQYYEPVDADTKLYRKIR